MTKLIAFCLTCVMVTINGSSGEAVQQVFGQNDQENHHANRGLRSSFATADQDLFNFMVQDPIPFRSLESCPCGYSSDSYTGDCGGISVKEDKWCSTGYTDFCCGTSEKECCRAGRGIVKILLKAGIFILFAVVLILYICCQCCAAVCDSSTRHEASVEAPSPESARGATRKMDDPTSQNHTSK